MSGAGIRLFLVICLLSAATFADACELSMKLTTINQPSFSCYRNETMTSTGTVTYDDCFVDTTNGAMKKDTGTFTVTDPGVYRLSFIGNIYVPGGTSGRPYGYIELIVDGQKKATSWEEPEDSMTSNYYTTISLNILQTLERGQKVEVRWRANDGAQLYDSTSHYTHFNGERISA